MSIWSRDQGINLCQKIEEIVPAFGAHVALTGGLLYKEGLRKDCDIILYRIRQNDFIDWFPMFTALEKIGFYFIEDHGFCKKCLYHGKPVDLFDPEDDGVYHRSDEGETFGDIEI